MSLAFCSEIILVKRHKLGSQNNPFLTRAFQIQNASFLRQFSNFSILNQSIDGVCKCSLHQMKLAVNKIASSASLSVKCGSGGI